jgi:NitT/TauT family transport system permease protein
MAMVSVTASVPLMLRFLAPFISALNALPKIALAPIFILWFGTGVTSKTLFVASLVTFMMFYATLFALKMLDQSLISNMRLLGASRIDLLLHVYAPAMVKQVISSLRTSSAWALLGAVIAEYLASNQGLGFLIAQGQQTFRTDVVVAGILVVAVLAVCIDRLLHFLERRLSRWSSTE